MAEERSDAFLRLIRRSKRGRLKVYLGYCAGVGKTYQMLQEGHRMHDEGIDVVIGMLETHGRSDITRLAQGLETTARRRQDYHGVVLEEMDLDAILARKPQVALIDELAHTNVPGSRNAKRYEDVQDILAAGIHVITTMNVQHLESLYNTIERAVRVKVRERLPDAVLAEADQIVDVDITTEDLRKRLEDGKIYPKERIEPALANFFKSSNLEKLRELALRELAAQIDLRRRAAPEAEESAAPEQIMVCLSSRGPNSEKLLRYASRLAGTFNRNWYAVYVQTPSEEATAIDAQTQRYVSDALTLAKQLGAMVFIYKGEDVADTILRFAKEYRVGHVIVGRPTLRPFWGRFGKNKDILKNLIKNGKGVTLIVLDTREEVLPAEKPGIEIPEELPPGPVSPSRPSASKERPTLTSWLTARRILIWNEPVSREILLKSLVEAAVKDSGIGDAQSIFDDVLAREEQGSTFFNEGVAFPHVRVAGLMSPVVAVGLTNSGVLDVTTEKPVDIVFLILSPGERPDLQVQLLGLASQMVQDRHLLQTLRSVQTAEEAMAVLRNWETNP